MKTRAISYLFFFVAGLNLAAQFFENTDMNQYTKPLLMPLLIYYIYHVAKGRITIHRLLLTVALIFSWIGDLLLLYQDQEWNFLAGLGAFLIAQLVYAYALYKATFRQFNFQLKPLIPIILYGLALLAIIVPAAGSFRIPVILYAIGILLMAGSARLRYKWTTNNSYNLAFFGATLFVISDSILAYNKFVNPVPLGSLWVMLTYISAQFLLVKGILAHPN